MARNRAAGGYALWCARRHTRQRTGARAVRVTGDEAWRRCEYDERRRG